MNKFINLKPPAKKKMTTADCLKKLPLSVSIKKITKPQAKSKEMNVEKYLSMIPKSIVVQRVKKPVPKPDPVFKIPEFLPPKIPRKMKIEEPSEHEKQMEEERPIEIEFIDMQRSFDEERSVIPFTDIAALDRRSKSLEYAIDAMSRNTAKLMVQAEIKNKKLLKIMKMMNVKVEKPEELIQKIDVELPITTVEELNELNKRLMEDRIFYQKFFKYLNIYRTKGSDLLKILTTIVTAECVTNYNWDGSFNKLGLKNLMLFSKFLKEFCIKHDMANDITYIGEMRKAIHKCKNLIYRNQPI